MSLTTVSLAIIGLSVICASSGSDDFSYKGIHGPMNWGHDYSGCVGKHQSPIDIEEHDVINVTLPFLQISGLDKPRNTYLMNNGHTVMLRVNDSSTAIISGGPLGPDPYVFEQLHFHWGANDSEGSEDLINNHSFAMELHAVFYKKSYGSLAKAVDYFDGLTVLAYFFEVSEEDNPIYNVIVDVLPTIEDVGSTTKLVDPLILQHLLVPEGHSLESYFTYNGSLTTPPCSEVVTWIDFKDALTLSHRQLEEFRNVQSNDGEKLTHNFRPIQPLEDRQIYYNVPETKHNNYGEQTKPTAFLTFGFVVITFTISPDMWIGILGI
ncbi:carbonic anhydrase 2-like [Chelonus insularis]|uniref:carbonic anhydrase 2-like n=1 Tax=Chelonus insularis TaxID=460826 RepID=UPI001588F221|nr:carbonic anhydrase 2-like [Chelonus insularis]